MVKVSKGGTKMIGCVGAGGELGEGEVIVPLCSLYTVCYAMLYVICYSLNLHEILIAYAIFI